ncbi:MAG: hypothetical protein IT379_36865 [Deltaproteobacteria bacterium]|nr:hypothetical protein [Deltaproteobacteria bacterium]
MANAALLMEWGMPRQGREHKALEVFFASMAQWEGWKAAGKIESFEVFGTLTGNYESRSGFLIARGTSAQITALQESEEFRQALVKVITIGNDVRLTNLETGDAMASRMQRYATTLKTLGV